MRVGLNDETAKSLLSVMSEIGSDTPSLTVAELISYYYKTKYPTEVNNDYKSSSTQEKM